MVCRVDGGAWLRERFHAGRELMSLSVGMCWVFYGIIVELMLAKLL